MDCYSEYRDILRSVFDTITYERGGVRYFSSRYDRFLVEANIRKAFCTKRTYNSRTEHIPESASLLNIANFSPVIHTQNTEDYFPEQRIVENIILADAGKFKIKPDILTTIQTLEEDGDIETANRLRKKYSSHPQKDRSFHYLPYHTDSGFEQTFLREVLPLPEVERFGLEVYYNGDWAMTEFKIKCYKYTGGGWNYIGMYTTDFLIIQRRDGKIHKALIVETKGRIYANDPSLRESGPLWSPSS